MQDKYPCRGIGFGKQGFSLIELVIVIVIIGVIGAIAIPRMTQGASNAGSSALKGDLQVLRQAVELYRAEHSGKFPATGTDATAQTFVDQMTKKTDIDGTVNDTSGKYGPYLAEIPKVPVGPYKDQKGVALGAAAAGATDGWVYDSDSGKTVTANTEDATDQNNVYYKNY